MERSHLRGSLALALGLVITLSLGIASLAIGLSTRLWFALTGLPKHFPPMTKVWSSAIEATCFRRLLATEVRTQGLVKTTNNDIVIILANHPPTIGIPTFFWWATKTFGGNLKVVAKLDHLKNLGALLYGWAFWAIGGGIFINRSSSKHALGKIRAATTEILPGTVITIFPDMHRPTTTNISLDHRHFAREHGIKERFYYTLMPRSGGLLALLNGLDSLGVTPRIFDATFALNIQADGVDELLDFYQGRVLIRFEEIPNAELPRNEEDLRLWLRASWRQKNRLIADWQGPNPESEDD